MQFLDHAATTPMDPRVRETVLRAMEQPLNASSVHQHGQRARAALEQAREEVAACFGLPPHQVVFTSSATEANNLAIRGTAERIQQAEGRQADIVSSHLEHSCVRETVSRLARLGAAELHYLPVNEAGTATIAENLPPFDLMCLMAVQNETGLIQPLKEARAARRNRPESRWLCDATQALNAMPLNVGLLGADFVSLSSHKIYGPPGVGLLAGPGVEELPAQITGGPQENEHRAGTQPIALIQGFADAVRLAREEADTRRRVMQEATGAFMEHLRTAGVSFQVNGSDEDRAPGFMNISLPGFSGADLVIALDARGFSVSSGAACATGVMETSRAMAAMFPEDADRAAGALRVTPGKDTSPETMRACAEALAELAARRPAARRFARR